MTPLEDRVRREVPRCLGQVTATPAIAPSGYGCVVTVFNLSHKSMDTAVARVLGYPLSDYNPACKGHGDFISPLILRWPDGSEACGFDSNLHGYHGEMQASAKLRGEGPKKNLAAAHVVRAMNCQTRIYKWGAEPYELPASRCLPAIARTERISTRPRAA